MDDDISVPHSMDTRWYAIDETGHVGIFDSGENGHVPDISTGEAEDLIDELWRHQHPEGGESPFEGEELTAQLHIFFYDYDDWSFDPISPYKRVGVPKTPLHVDQLPPSLRQKVKLARLTKIDFASDELVQPLEHYDCIYWYEENRVAYLCGDGKTVRPIPDMEHRFAEFCKQFRQENPEAAKQLIFEGLQEEPEKKRPPRKRRKKGDKGN